MFKPDFKIYILVCLLSTGSSTLNIYDIDVLRDGTFNLKQYINEKNGLNSNAYMIESFKNNCTFKCKLRIESFINSGLIVNLLALGKK